MLSAVGWCIGRRPQVPRGGGAHGSHVPGSRRLSRIFNLQKHSVLYVLRSDVTPGREASPRGWRVSLGAAVLRSARAPLGVSYLKHSLGQKTRAVSTQVGTLHEVATTSGFRAL